MPAHLSIEAENLIYQATAAFQAKDIDRYMSFFADNYLAVDDAGTPQNTSDDKVLRYNDLKAATEIFFNEVERIHLKISGIEVKMGVHPTARTFAEVYCYEEMEYKPKGKEPLTKATEKKYTLYKRPEGGWIIGPPIGAIYVPLREPAVMPQDNR